MGLANVQGMLHAKVVLRHQGGPPAALAAPGSVGGAKSGKQPIEAAHAHSTPQPGFPFAA